MKKTMVNEMLVGDKSWCECVATYIGDDEMVCDIEATEMKVYKNLLKKWRKEMDKRDWDKEEKDKFVVCDKNGSFWHDDHAYIPWELVDGDTKEKVWEVIDREEGYHHAEYVKNFVENNIKSGNKCYLKVSGITSGGIVFSNIESVMSNWPNYKRAWRNK